MALTRSENMARILAADTSPERRLRRALWHTGLRYRVQYAIKRIRTDLAFPRERVAVFVDGCFWHGCPDHYVRPRSRAGFWSEKLRQNVERDRRQTLELEASGWRVCRFWEHEVHEELPAVVDEVERALKRATRSQRADDWRVASVVPLDENGDYERRLLVSLRSPEKTRQIDQQRHTRKWRVSQDA